MALLPDPNQIRRETPTPSSGVVSYRAGIAETANAEMGAELAKMADIEGQRIDNSVVEQAYTELRQKRAELSAGDKGYKTVTGSKVVSAPEGGKPFVEDYTQRFAALADGIGSQLSAGQREKFSALAAKEGVAFQTDLLEHSLREAEKFHAEARAGAIDTEMQLGVANWQDSTKSAESLARINRVYDSLIVDGHAADKVDSMRAVSVSNFHKGILDQANASGNTDFAKTYFDQHKKEILDAETVGKGIAKEANSKVDAAVGLGAAEAYLAEPNATGDIEKINAAIRDDPRLAGDPDRIRAAQTAAAERVRDRRDSLNQRDAAVYRMLLDGKPLSTVKGTPEWRALSVKDQNAVIERAKNGGGEGGSQLASFYKLKNDPSKLHSMTEDEIVLFGRDKGLSNSMVANLLEANSQMRKAPEKIIEAKVDAEAFNVAYRAHTGKDPVSKGDKEDADLARYRIENRVDAEQKSLGRQLDRQRKDQIIREELRPVAAKTWYGGTKEVPAYRAGGASLAIPAKDAERIKGALQKQAKPGTQITQEQIDAAWRIMNNLPPKGE